MLGASSLADADPYDGHFHISSNQGYGAPVQKGSGMHRGYGFNVGV